MDFECSICLENLFSVNTYVSVTQCGHIYHKSCLESGMQNNRRCPICKTENINIVKTIFPNVYKELDYSCCSNDTKEFIEEILDNEREKRKIFLKIIKRLDKENTSLKETNTRCHNNLKSVKMFLQCFNKDTKDLKKNCKFITSKNNTLLSEIKKIDNGSENVSAMFNAKCEKQIKEYHFNDNLYSENIYDSCKDSCSSDENYYSGNDDCSTFIETLENSCNDDSSSDEIYYAGNDDCSTCIENLENSCNDSCSSNENNYSSNADCSRCIKTLENIGLFIYLRSLI